MATTNPVYQLLFPTGNQAVLAAGNRPESLAVGQLGFFNFHTGLSIDGSVAADAKDIYIMVGTDPSGVSALSGVDKSAGQMIQVRNAKSLTFRGTVANQAKIVDVLAFKAKCETNYVLKVELRNGASYMLHGYNQFAKSWSVYTGCCSDQCEPCGDGDCNEISQGLVNQINADPDKLLTASYIVNKITATVAAEPTASGDIVVTVGSTAYTVAIVDADTVTTAAAKIVTKINTQAGSPYWASNVAGVISIYPKTSTNGSTETLVYTTPVAGMTITPIVAATKTAVADPTAFITANPGVCLGIRITANAEAINNYTSINQKYHHMRATDILVTLVDGFACNGTVTTVQDLAYAEGSGYDLKQLEYVAGGWNGRPGPYRVSETTGLDRGVQYKAVAASNYNIFDLTYDQMSVGGWLEYLNNLETIIAVPCADATTLSGIATVLDAIFTQFGAMAGDVTANGDCTNTRTGALTAATDGIESLA